jgi:hypothetical protein
MLGGKARRPSPAGLLFQARQPLLEEPLSPLADDLPRGVETGSDLIVVQTLGSIEDHFGPNDIAIR